MEHLLFDVFDVSELGPTSNITAFGRTLDPSNIPGVADSNITLQGK